MRLWHTDFKISHKGLIMVAVPLALNLLVLLMLAYLLHQQELETDRESKAKLFYLLTSNLERTFAEAGITFSSTIVRNDQSIAEKCDRIIGNTHDMYDQLSELEKDTPEQLERLNYMRTLEDRVFKVFEAAKEAVLEGRDGMLLLHQQELRMEVQELIRAFLKETGVLVAQERVIQKARYAASQNSAMTLRYIIAAGILANVALSITLAIFFGRSISNRLRTIMGSTKLVAKEEDLPAAMPGRDEIAILDKVYHEMALTLRETRRRERAVVDNALDIICTVGEERAFTALSPACRQVWGYEPAELVGKTMDEIVTADDRAGTIEKLSSRNISESEFTFENKVTSKAGTTVNMLWSAYWSQPDRTYFCVAHDITAQKTAEALLKESESRIRKMIESMPVGLLILSDNGFIEATNPSVETMLDRSYDQLLGMHAGKLIVSGAAASAEDLTALLEKFLHRVGEASCARSDGALLPVELSLNQFQFRGERKYLAILVDISERRKLEAAREELINMVSHDLRTPLNSVQATMALLESGTLGQLDQSQVRTISRCDAEMQRLLALVNGLLDLEKMQAGMLELDREINSLSHLVTRSIDSVSALAEQSQVTLVNKAGQCELLCDGDRLMQVLVHLLMDAIRRSSAGHNVTVTAGESDGAALVKLKLDGCRDQKPDAGLGLAICNGIITAHKGALGVDFDGSSGASLWFTIPLPEDCD